MPLPEAMPRRADSPGPGSSPDSGFLSLLLGPSLASSCGYFREGGIPLEDAQRAGHDHRARKLRLRPYQTLLEVGAGWGSFLIHACREYGVTAYGLVESEDQASYANRWIQREGLEEQARVDCAEPRDLLDRVRYDRIGVNGWLERARYRDLAERFRSLRGLLNDGGILLLEGRERAQEGQPDPIGTGALAQVFPDGAPPSLTAFVHQLEDNGLEVQDVENLRTHYAQTAGAWVKELRRNRDACLAQVDEPTYRAWLFRLAMTSLLFEEGRASFHQVQVSKRGDRVPSPSPAQREAHG